MKKLGVTPEANPVSASLSAAGVNAAMTRLKSLDGAAFDRAYAAQEAGYHKTVNAALKDTLIPSADNARAEIAARRQASRCSASIRRHAEHLAADLN